MTRETAGGDTASDAGTTRGLEHISSILARTLQAIERSVEGSSPEADARTGLDELDLGLGGLTAGSLITVSGARDLCRALLYGSALATAHPRTDRASAPAWMVLPRGEEDDAITALLGMDADIDLSVSFITEEEWGRLIATAAALGDAPLFLVDDAGIDEDAEGGLPPRMVARVRALAPERRPAVIVYPNLGDLVSDRAPQETIKQTVGALKHIARTCNTVVLVGVPTLPALVSGSLNAPDVPSLHALRGGTVNLSS